jgi:hypothetical protein
MAVSSAYMRGLRTVNMARSGGHASLLLDFCTVPALPLIYLSICETAAAEGVEARSLSGHLNRAEPLVNPIR